MLFHADNGLCWVYKQLSSSLGGSILVPVEVHELATQAGCELSTACTNNLKAARLPAPGENNTINKQLLVHAAMLLCVCSSF